ncbi:hypothetical protein NE619_11775 [Anaerovorax odorimutans]|uniref:ECF transporter S component n=1 Tax=Anaerovorax odorimutans TaxID=109327 RepID=A0ABT1RQG6_9FIRM|nr:hypothetical protein [Anaerovorax odorimutans]MCQ4637404.1 hypothetical protein [Anaerovorax odorimutans]
MNRQKVKRYVILMIVSVALNLGLYAVAHYCHLPMWLDSVGTGYAAVVLEPAAGLIVALATNFYQATAFYGMDALFYYFTGALAAVCFGCILRKNGQLLWRRLPLAGGVYIVMGTLMSGGLSLWRAKGHLDSGWESYFMQWAMDNLGAGHAAGVLFGTLVLKVIDGVILACLLPILFKLTPKEKRK